MRFERNTNMMTRKEEGDEFWMLTQGILQDSRVDTSEARVVKRWLEEHKRGTEFDRAIAKLDKFLTDGFIDRFESKDMVESIGLILRTLRNSSEE